MINTGHWSNPLVRFNEIWLALGWWIAIIGIIFAAMFPSIEGIAVAVLAFAPLYFGLDRKFTPNLLIGPATLAYLSHGLGFGLGPLTWIYAVGRLPYYQDGFAQAQWGAIMGLVSFALVYALIFQYHNKHNYFNEGIPYRAYLFPVIDDTAWKRYTLILFGVFSMIVIFDTISGAQQRLGGPAQLSVLMQTLSAMFRWVSIVIWFFLGFGAVRFGKGWASFWLITFLLYAFYIFVEGSRGPVIMAGVLSAIGASSAGFSRRKLFIGIFIFVLIFSPMAAIVSDYRNSYSADDTDISTKLEQFWNTIQETRSTGHAGTGLFSTIFIQSTAHTVDNIFLLTPYQVPYAGLENLERVLYLFVPRLFINDRPNLQDGGEIACLYGTKGGMWLPDDPRCGVGDYTPTVGDAYRRFGWLGIPLVYAFNTLIYTIPLYITWRRRTEPESAAMFIFLVLSFHNFWAETLLSIFYTLAWTFPKYFIFFSGSRWLMNLFWMGKK